MAPTLSPIAGWVFAFCEEAAHNVTAAPWIHRRSRSAQLAGGTKHA